MDFEREVASLYEGCQQYLPTFEPTLHQESQLWLC